MITATFIVINTTGKIKVTFKHINESFKSLKLFCAPVVEEGDLSGTHVCLVSPVCLSLMSTKLVSILYY